MRREGGFVLLGVFVVVLLCSMIAVSLIYRLQAEQTASSASAGAEQAWAAAMSGVQEALRILAHPALEESLWQDNPDSFRDRLVGDDGGDRWYFTIYSPPGEGGEEPRYGLTDEAGKLNVNYADEAMLSRVPGLSTSLAHALLDYIDADDEPLEEGAEQDYYETLPEPYSIRNGPLQTLGELLLVRGFTPALVYGREGVRRLSGHSLTSGLEAGLDEGVDADAGLRHHLTVWSYDLNQTGAGEPRVQLDDPAQALDETGLPAPVLGFIAAAREAGIVFGHPADLLGLTMITSDTNGNAVEIESGVGPRELAILLDRCTAVGLPRLNGLVNINTASAAVLQTLPGIDEALAESIVGARPNLTLEQRRTPAWMYEDEILDAAQFKALAPRITTRGWHFSFRVIGYGVPSGRHRILEVVLDVARERPAVIYLRDVTRLGLPFPITPSMEVVRG